MFDLKGFRKEKRLSQKQISAVLGIGTSFISQIETGKDPMPGYIPDKLAEAFGKEEVEKYYREPQYRMENESSLRKRYMFSNGSAHFQPRTHPKASGEIWEAKASESPTGKRIDAEWIDRLLNAFDRRDELAIMQQKEYERQGARIDDLLAMLKE